MSLASISILSFSNCILLGQVPFLSQFIFSGALLSLFGSRVLHWSLHIESTLSVPISLPASQTSFAKMRTSIDIASVSLLAISLQTALTASIGHLIPKSTVDIPYSSRHLGYIASKVRRDAHALTNGHELYHARNVAPSPSAVAVNIQPSAMSSPILDTASWNSQTVEACAKAVGAMNGVASNPSGMAACYNVRQLDNSTGVFEADVRLYRVAQPTNGWTTQSITVGMSYLGAAVALERSGNAKRDSTIVTFPTEKRGVTLPQTVQNLTFAGKVNDDLMGWLKNQYASFISSRSYLVSDTISIGRCLASSSHLRLHFPARLRTVLQLRHSFPPTMLPFY